MIAVKHVFSITIALVVSYIIGKFLFNKETPHGPNSDHIKSTIYRDQKQCYMMKPIAHICPFQKLGN